MKRRRRQSERGFATIVAVMMIAMVATAMVALTQRFAQDARQTKDDRRDLQIQQMLHAGVAEAITRARRAPAGLEGAFSKSIEPALPPALVALEGKLVLRPEKAGNDWLVHITAVLDGRAREQVLRLAQSEGRWSAVDLSLP